MEAEASHFKEKITAFLTVKETNYWARLLRKLVELSVPNVFKSRQVKALLGDMLLPSTMY